MKALSRLYSYIRCIPKTLFFNFYYLPFNKACKFPIIVSHSVKFQKIREMITIPDDAKTAKIKIGFGRVPIRDNKYSRLVWNLEEKGVINFGNNIKIGAGCKLYISGLLCLGDRTNFSGESSIICSKEINFGHRCLISWDTLFMDTDFHSIVNGESVCLNPDKRINIGDSVWVCARSTILKGTSIGANSVISASSHVISSFGGENIIGGNPAKIIGSMVGKKFGSSTI